MGRRAIGAGHEEAGFSLIEMMIAMTILMIVSGVVMSGVSQLTRINQNVSNRADMHSGVRNATELLQQEVGQAGRLSLPTGVTVTGAVAIGAGVVGVSGGAGSMFPGEQVIIDTGDNEETVTLTAVTPGPPGTIGATFAKAHLAGVPVTVQGGFSSGIVPEGGTGSSGTKLKIVGDIHGTGSLVYVEYWCDIATATPAAPGRLYRTSMAWDAAPATKIFPPAADKILIQNVLPNPDGTPCFRYQPKVVNARPFVVGVAVTLTVQTQGRDTVTGTFQTETKALLNVSPRNVFNVWEMAGLGIMNRVQDLPAKTALLIP